jgi:hypothetical protein
LHREHHHMRGRRGSVKQATSSSSR